MSTNSAYKLFRELIVGPSEPQLDYRAITDIREGELKTWEAKVKQQVEFRQKVGAGGDEEKTASAPSDGSADGPSAKLPDFLPLEMDWVKRRQINLAEKFLLDEEKNAALRVAKIRTAKLLAAQVCVV